MGRLAWPLRPLPDGRGEVWRWDLGGLSELPKARAALRNRLGVAGFPPAEEDTAGSGWSWPSTSSPRTRCGTVSHRWWRPSWPGAAGGCWT
ncbi:hypothetical protein [Blastococcus brunescens]|uniref:Uncharacterized protein n=1 Tax=Blastococcus brunescens TaxID=1564165 RepID=A0ABZ1BBJ8_9ACTN|nr:hypothetical protein [Blastococcus sp. BMG 8361]WRL67321.1 hypothetical protein U6N30_29215 [Blastococcus sp. BMG 8361]